MDTRRDRDRQNSESVDDEETSFDYNDDAFDESDDSLVDSWQDSDDEEEQIEAEDRQRTSTTSTGNYSYLFIVFGVIVIAMIPIWFQSTSNNSFTLLKSFFNSNTESVDQSTRESQCLSRGEKLFTKSQLAKYIDKPRILLAFLGVVYDVTEGPYYQPKGSYHFFAGKDGTRAFLTGEFTTEELIDDIHDLDDSYINGIETWLSLYDEKYTRVGVVHGTYYDQRGCATDKLRLVEKKIQRTKNAQENDNIEQSKYPPCNSEWNATSKQGRVWCSKLSGGISRDWIGRPRQIYSLKSKSWRCGCIREDDDVEIDQWCDRNDGQNNKQHEVGSSAALPTAKKSGVTYSEKHNDELVNSTPICLFKHYSNCDSQTTECSFSD